MADKSLNKDLAGIQSLVGKLQAQVGDGEVDAKLIDEIASAINVAVSQDGSVHDKVAQAAEAGNAAMGTDFKPAPEPDGDEGKPFGDNDGDEGVAKVTAPVAARPPRADYVVPGAAEDNMRAQLPGFIKALEGGSMRKAQEISGRSQPAFDAMFNMACKAVLTEGGWTHKNMGKILASYSGLDSEDLKKGITAATVPGIYLMRLAKLMMPVYAGLRRRFPTATPSTGADQATWRTQLGFSNLSQAALMSVAEAAIGEEITESFLTFQTPYRELAVNDKVTLKAIAAGKGYDDPMQISIIRTMTALLMGEERKILGDNSAAIAKPTSVTATGGGSGTLGNSTDKFIVSALTYRGYIASSTGGTGAVGETDGTLSSAVDLSAKASVTVTWPACKGAVAYNVFYNPASHATNKYYIGTYTANSVTLTTLPSSGNAPSASNVSANAYGFEGLLSWAELSTIYSQVITNKVAMVDNAGATLTAGTSGISQFDSILASMWTQWQIAPTLMVASPAMVGAITDKILGLNSGAMYRIEVSQERGTMQGGAFISGYVNKFAPYADGTPRYIDIIPHPYMVDGTIAFLSETIPYPMSRESRGFAVDTLIPYTYFPLAASVVNYPYALTCSEVLECYHPAAQTALVGVAVS